MRVHHHVYRHDFRLHRLMDETLSSMRLSSHAGLAGQSLGAAEPEWMLVIPEQGEAAIRRSSNRLNRSRIFDMGVTFSGRKDAMLTGSQGHCAVCHEPIQNSIFEHGQIGLGHSGRGHCGSLYNFCHTGSAFLFGEPHVHSSSGHTRWAIGGRHLPLRDLCSECRSKFS